MSGVLFSPHSDDEALFACYTVLRHRPTVVICFPSERDYGNTNVRYHESRMAMFGCGVRDVVQWHARTAEDLAALMRRYDEVAQPAVAWAPSEEASHMQHAQVAVAAQAVFGDRVRQYHTYDHAGKVRRGRKVPIEPGWEDIKRASLRCYETQIRHPRAGKFFEEARYELDEYEAVPSPWGTTDPWYEDTERHERQGQFQEPCGVDDCTICGDTLEPNE